MRDSLLFFFALVTRQSLEFLLLDGFLLALAGGHFCMGSSIGYDEVDRVNMRLE